MRPTVRATFARHNALWAFLAIAVLYALAIGDRWTVRPDCAFYLSLGRSLARGDGMAFNGMQYWGIPPLVPMMIAGCRMLVGEHYWLINLVITLMALGTVALIYRLATLLAENLGDTARRIIPLGVLVATGLSARLFIDATRIMTDVPFTFFVTLGIYGFVRGVRHDWRWHFLAAAALALATLTRLPGLVFAAGVAMAAVGALWRQRGMRLYGALGLVALVAAVFLLWFTLVRPLRQPGTIDYITPITARLSAESLSWEKLAEIGQSLARFPEAFCGSLVGQKLGAGGFNLVPTAVLLVGMIAMVRRRQAHALVPTLVYLAFLLAYTPGAVSARYFLPAMPMLAYAFLLGMATLASWRPRRRRAGAPAITPRTSKSITLTLTITVAICVAISGPKIVRQIHWAHQGSLFAERGPERTAPYIECGRYLALRGKAGHDQVIGPKITILLYVSDLRSPTDRYDSEHFDRQEPSALIETFLTNNCRFLVVPTDLGDWSTKMTAAIERSGRFALPPKKFGRLRLYERATFLASSSAR